MPTFKDRYYTSPPSTHNISAQYIFDASAVNTGATPPTTGVWRAATPEDFSSSISVSGGLSMTVGAVAITGNPQVQVSNIPYQIGISGDINTTGTLCASGSLSLEGSVGISGKVDVLGSTYTSNLTGVTSGLFSIPTGTKSWSIAVESGSCYFNQTLLNEGTNINGGGYDGRYTLSSSINIGCTGGRTIVMWEI